MAEELHIQVDERAKEGAEKVLMAQGVSLDTAINRFLCAIAVTKDLPYKEEIPLPDLHAQTEHDPMSLEELGRQVLASKESASFDIKHAFAEIERRYGL